MDFRLTSLDPLLMNAFNNVNLAAACILTSTEYAEELGIPKSQWIYPLGGAGTSDNTDCKSHQLLYAYLTGSSLEKTQLLFKSGTFTLS